MVALALGRDPPSRKRRSPRPPASSASTTRHRDCCYGTSFDRRVRNLGITQARTPFRSPRANAIAQRWVRSVRTECLDHVFIFSEWHLQRSWPSMSAISTTGARIVRSDNVHPARPGHARRIEATKLERSSQYHCLEASITSISRPHDLPDRYLRPTPLQAQTYGDLFARLRRDLGYWRDCGLRNTKPH